MTNEEEHTPVEEAEPTAETTADAAVANATPDADDSEHQPIDIEDMQAALAAAEAKATENLEGWQRARAEFTNYKKRVERERDDLFNSAAADVLKDLLPIIDDFERAMANVPEAFAEDPWVSGTSLISKAFEKLLDKYDVEIIDPVGDVFDPNQHEAVGMDDDTDIESGHVTTTLQRGYTRANRVLRPALVRVAS